MGKGKVNTLRAYIALIWDYKPKNKRVPCLKDWIEDDVKKDPKAWEKNPARRLNNAVYSYRIKARGAGKLKFNKSVGHDALVQNSNLLADHIIEDKKIPFKIRKSFVIEGVGIEALQPVPPKAPLRKELLREARELGVTQPKHPERLKPKHKRTKEERRKKAYKKFKKKYSV